MKSLLQICTLQIPVFWNKPEANRKQIENYIKELQDTDIVVLPETFTTGFAVVDLYPETMDGPTIKWLVEISLKYNTAIIGSLFITENKKTYNRLVLVTPEGEIAYYDKWHLFGMGNESKLITKGDKLPVFEYLGWKIKPLVCYDLRFPITIRNTQAYDVIICIANWPEPRIDAWNTLLKARAIENLCYVVGVNRVGEDNYKNIYNGHSNTYNPSGKAMLEVSTSKSIQKVVLKKSEIHLTRLNFPFLEDKDSFEIL